MIPSYDDRYCLYAAVDVKTNGFDHIGPYQTTTTGRPILFLRELREKHHVANAEALVDGADHLEAAHSRLGLRFQTM